MSAIYYLCQTVCSNVRLHACRCTTIKIKMNAQLYLHAAMRISLKIRLLIVTTLFLLAGTARAQFDQLVVEVFDPSVINPAWAAIAEANGYTTYRLYVEMANPGDRLVELTSQVIFDSSTGTSEECIVTFINPSTYFYNEVNVGGNLGDQINPLFFPVFETVVGDSWLTIGMPDQLTPADGQVFTVGYNLTPTFNTPEGTAFTGTDGSVFGLPTLSNTLGVGPNNRVLIGQLTTNSDFSFGFNLSIIEANNPSSISYYTHSDCFVPANINVGATYTPAPDQGLLGPNVVASVNLISDNACGEEVASEVCTSILLGVPPFEIELVPAGGGAAVASQTGQALGEYCFQNIGCVNESGDYNVVITDAIGFTSQYPFQVSCPTTLAISTEVTDVTCNGETNGEIEVTVTGGTGTVTLSTDVPGFDDFTGTTPFSVTITDVGAGTYSLSVDDVNECAFATTVTVEEPDAAAISLAVNDAACAGQCSGTVTFTAEGGTPPFELEVTNLAGTVQNANALCAGTYTATVFDANGCGISEEIVVAEPEAISYGIDVQNISCNGAADGAICITSNSGGTGQISWQIVAPGTASTPYGTEPCFENLQPGSYTLNFQDEAGCVITQANVVVEEPGPLDVAVTANDISCFSFADGSITVDFTGGTGVVSLIEPSFATLPTVLEGLTPGEYTLIIEDETGCQSNTTVVLNEPDPLTVAVGQITDISCGGTCNGEVELLIEGGTGEPTILLNGIESGTTALCANEYEVTIVDENGCEATEFFEIVEPEPISFLINASNVTCTGMNDGSVNIFPVGGVGQVTWNIVEDVDPNNLFEGTYTIVGQDGTGCTADTTFSIGANLITDMELSAFSSPVTCWEENDGTATVAVTGGTLPISIQWNDQMNQITATAVGLSEGVYSVVATDAIGCTLSSLVEVEPTVGCFFIASVLTPNGDGFNDDWVIGGLEFFPNSMVQVFNRWGQLMFESRGYNTRWDGQWNGRRVAVADYYYVITYDESQEPITGTVTVKY